MLRRNGENGIPCLVSNVRENAFSITIKYDVIHTHTHTHTQLRKFLFIASLLRVLSWTDVNYQMHLLSYSYRFPSLFFNLVSHVD